MIVGPITRDLPNVFLQGMTAADFQALLPYMSIVDLPRGRNLSAVGEDFEYVCLPINCVISLMVTFSDGSEVEVRSVGNEGIVGAGTAILGFNASTATRVQVAGSCVLVQAARIRARSLESRDLMRLTLKFAQANLAQTESSLACRQIHTLDTRLARWLLISQDRVGDAQIHLNQDDMGAMTGAQRSSISLTASEFKRAGLIDYSRGRVEILDRAGLHRLACECYETDRARVASLR